MSCGGITDDWDRDSCLRNWPGITGRKKRKRKMSNPLLIKSLYESNPDTEAFTTNDKLKLDSTQVLTIENRERLDATEIFTQEEKDKLAAIDPNAVNFTQAERDKLEALMFDYVGDIKLGLQNGDHDGWLILDGRALSTLTTDQQTNAASLGFTTNLPDSRGRYFAGGTALNPVGDVTGSNTILLGQSNLPQVTLSGVTNTTGNHNHSVVGAANQSNQVPGGGSLTRASQANRTTNTTGNHSHTLTVDLNPNPQEAIDNRPETLMVNAFIFLG